MKTLILAIVLLASPCYGAGSFRDVQKDHWAAGSVQQLADEKIVRGYPDGSYRGDKPVTRYELAVALQNMIEFIRRSEKPLVGPDSKTTLAPPSHWSGKSVTFLKTHGFLPGDSKLLTGGDKPVTYTELASALTSVASRLIELRVPPPSPTE